MYRRAIMRRVLVVTAYPAHRGNRWLLCRTSFPDLHLTIKDMIAEGDEVATRWTLRGTNTGDMVTPMFIPATDKQVTVTDNTIDRIASGKLVEDRHQADMLNFMQQLGLLPAPV
jgi:predicted ester cyclase